MNERYHRELDKSSLKFLKALETYHASFNEKEKLHLRSVMDEQLLLIHAAVDELKRAGIHKEEIRVEHDYRAYLTLGTPETYAALEHDLVTLRDYNKL